MMGGITSPSVPRSPCGRPCSTFAVLKGRCPVPLLKVKPERPQGNLRTEFFGAPTHHLHLTMGKNPSSSVPGSETGDFLEILYG